ncbi:hypothetical protein HJC23_007482 [Cyclotella cryptica]|uniref:Methyltransferase type 11 domain-containing protein n=1 Tax=Cyclotella cryptica TaxID=29204 RepID=A0ABD3NUC2_9STRA
MVTAFQSLPSDSHRCEPVQVATNSENFQDGRIGPRMPCPQRREFFSRVSFSIAGMCTSLFLPISSSDCKCYLRKVPPSAGAIIELSPPPATLLDPYDPARNSIMDSVFSWSMATTMEDYEEEARPYKTELFQSLFDSLAADAGSRVPVIVEVGMGTFPNAPYFSQSMISSKLAGLDIIGVDPNDSMKQYALKNAEKSGLLASNVSLRIVHGVAEALPFPDASVDAVVVTLTLCSVSNPERAVSEIRRILKPNTGKFIFWEHVLSESDKGLSWKQELLSPLQTFADGCHLNRRTGLVINNAGFQFVDQKYTTMENADFIGPTVFGIATK